MSRRVVVTGLGLVTPLGVGVQHTWRRLLLSHSGVVSTSHLGPKFATLPSQVAGLVPLGPKKDGGWNASEHLDRGDERSMAKFTQYAVAAAAEAIADSGFMSTLDDAARENVGVVVGSGIGSLEDAYDTSVAFDKGGHKRTSPLFVPRLLINLAAGHIALKHNFHGPNLSPTAACTTGLHALASAASLIRSPSPTSPNIVLAGASESCIHPLALSGFARARSLSTSHTLSPTTFPASHSSRPFDRSRDGFVIAEGAAILVLEEAGHARARGATVYAELAGSGLSCDAWHMTAPRDDGRGALLAMSRALEDAGIAPQDVDYVNAHATSTALGDAAENAAIRSALVDKGGRAPGSINVSSTKGATGHLLGAAGAVEAAFTVLAMRDGMLPPTLHLDEVGGGSEGDCAGVWDMNYVPHRAQRRDMRVALANSFGFGGTNASVCFVRPEGHY